ncbi:hypothetical protein ROU88_01410 [Macrococcus capreoli]|uniref:hypothetical protein n=1 Tax=Macrococcus capreoli TaxID=2982690 RepID=UPI0021D5A2F9|nr:hypothetical protein [Macrococcus sp. TMW 2.2395]MCU7557607.1 hypothetical protein [Macrococcus sp. TMW 2.2395]
MIQIKGKVKFNITLDPSTFIFDDRKVEMEQLLNGQTTGEETITFQDNYEWNREILEGASKPPTLISEKKYKKQALLEGTFLMNMHHFIINAEPDSDATHVALSNEATTVQIPLEALKGLYFQFSKDGKRLYEDGMVDAFVYDQDLKLVMQHVTGIEIV